MGALVLTSARSRRNARPVVINAIVYCAGGVSQPSRTASASSASTRSGLRPGRGGTISATTRSRSVTSTVSPPAARRTYSLSLFLRSFRPTEKRKLRLRPTMFPLQQLNNGISRRSNLALAFSRQSLPRYNRYSAENRMQRQQISRPVSVRLLQIPPCVLHWQDGHQA